MIDLDEQIRRLVDVAESQLESVAGEVSSPTGSETAGRSRGRAWTWAAAAAVGVIGVAGLLVIPRGSDPAAAPQPTLPAPPTNEAAEDVSQGRDSDNDVGGPAEAGANEAEDVGSCDELDRLVVACADLGGAVATIEELPDGTWGLVQTDLDTLLLGTPRPLPDGVDGWWVWAPLGERVDSEFDVPPRCVIVVPGSGDGWRQTCEWFGQGNVRFVTLLDGVLVQIDGEDGAVLAVTDLSSGVWPASGCDIAALKGVVEAILERVPFAMIDSIACEGENHSLTPSAPAWATAAVGSQLLPVGAPDGLIVIAERSEGTWDLTDLGTELDVAPTLLPIPSVERWSDWPGDTAPADGLKSIGEVPAGITTLGELAAAVVELVDRSSTDDSLPAATVSLVDTVMFFDGPAVVVVETEEVGDDSVGGSVYFVWANTGSVAGGTDEWRLMGASVSQVCLRGERDLSSPFCV